MTPGHLLIKLSQIRQTNQTKNQGKSGEVILPGLSQGGKSSE